MIDSSPATAREIHLVQHSIFFRIFDINVFLNILFMNIAIYLFMINEKKIIILKYTLEE